MSALLRPGQLPFEFHAGVRPADSGVSAPEALSAARQGRQWKPPELGGTTIDWKGLGVVPRYIGDETAGCVAALQPSMYHNSGATELTRFLAGTASRHEPAILVSIMGDVEPTILNPLVHFDDSVSLHGEKGRIGGRRLPTGAVPEIADSATGADRDLGLRILGRSRDLPWWALELIGTTYHLPGNKLRSIPPAGKVEPIVVNALDEVLVGVWVAPKADPPMRWYVVPAGTNWETVIKWLTSSAIPQYVPDALRRSRAGELVDDALLTVAELEAKKELERFEDDTRRTRTQLEDAQQQAQATADCTRAGLLYGTGTILVDAVQGVLGDAGYRVIDLDTLFGTGSSADLLASRAGQHWLIEVKSASGQAGERFLDDLQRHVRTWPTLRAETLAGAALVVNHQHRLAPADRTPAPYSRPEFIASLTHPVISSLTLFAWWRDQNLEAVSSAIQSPAHCYQVDLNTRTSGPTLSPPKSETVSNRRRLSRRGR